MPSCSRAARASATAPRWRATLATRLRTLADWKASGRGASTKESTRLPAASTTGLGMGLAPQLGQEETFCAALGWPQADIQIAHARAVRPRPQGPSESLGDPVIAASRLTRSVQIMDPLPLKASRASV